MNLNEAQDIAMKWRVNRRLPVITVDVAKADELFKSWAGGYLGKDEEHPLRKGSRQKFKDYVVANGVNNTVCPTVIIVRDSNRPPFMMFMEGPFCGRHSYCVLRDLGVSKMIMNCIHPSERIAKELGILIEENKEN